ncbi:hypothetical protein [Kitasatospora fiedleri]|uniref:hypothetical protein n=1 Tax=Kitasatospora fiedleri TaxID=2991545 RepID=UPI00249A6F9B|nr:hypothetical protein [Kitasatospora fiedleri]
MGLRSYLGFGGSNSSSNGGGSGSGSAGTRTTTSGSSNSGGWHTYDEATAREHHRTAQVSVPAAEYSSDGTRKLSPRPAPQDTNRSFWRS